VTRRMVLIPEMLIATTTTHALKTAVTPTLDSVYTKERLAMTTMHVPETAAVLKPDNALTPLFLALMETHVPLILVMQLRDVSTLLNMT